MTAATTDAPPAAGQACRLCGAAAAPLFRQRLLGRHDVAYFRCPACDLIQTEAPYWLPEAYSAAISAYDTGAVARNLATAPLTLLVARACGVGRGARFLDYGGGHGVFARLMRDLGLDYHWSDKYAENLFARGFEARPGERFEFVTAFEVLEHFADARGELERLFAGGPSFVLVGTRLHEGQGPGWWYYMPESGQHVALYSARTLRWAADRFGYDCLPGPAYSLFARRGVRLRGARRALAGAAVRRPKLGFALGCMLMPSGLLRSRTWRDHVALKERDAAPGDGPPPPSA
jgi:hypothetical protein